MIRRACLAALLLTGRAAAQSPAVVVRDAGPGPVGRYLQTVLADPGTRVVSTDYLRIPRDSVYHGNLVVLGHRADVSGTVHGDIVVVGGDLFLKPGGRIGGEGIAIGGGAYGSLLGFATRLTSYRDFTFDATTTGAVTELRYRETYVGGSDSFLSLPEIYGLRTPTYDRSSGVALPFGPALAVGRGEIDLLATYRSQLGEVDPSAEGRLVFNRKVRLEGFIGREARTNEDWINNRLTNSANALLTGRDERNWYRAAGGWVRLARVFETPTMTATYSLRGSFERASAIRPGAVPTSGPWSLVGRADDQRMFRPNPQIAGGDITSVMASAGHRWTAGVVKARLDLDLEVPVSVSTGETFVQATVDWRVEFPTFGLQRYRMEIHGVLTGPDSVPWQRFAYIGGSGTLATEGMLSAGGDQLLFIESRYEIPFTRVVLPFVGPPKLTLRHILGSAGVQALPDLVQIIGVRVSIPYIRVQLLMDTESREKKFSAGFSLSR